MSDVGLVWRTKGAGHYSAAQAVPPRGGVFSAPHELRPSNNVGARMEEWLVS